MKRAQPLPDAGLARAAEILEYEIGMLVATAGRIESWSGPKDPTLNALLESFLVHARQIIEFLTRQELDYVTDFRAADFCPPEIDWGPRAKHYRAVFVDPLPSGKPNLKKCADREVAHLTLERGGAHKTNWDTAKIHNDLVDALKEFATNYGCLMDVAMRGRIRQLNPLASQSVRLGGVISTTTTSPPSAGVSWHV